jgi:hypothetical protein
MTIRSRVPGASIPSSVSCVVGAPRVVGWVAHKSTRSTLELTSYPCVASHSTAPSALPPSQPRLLCGRVWKAATSKADPKTEARLDLEVSAG